MAESSRHRWERKVDFAAHRLADHHGKDWDKLPDMSRWFASKARFRHMASVAIGAGNLWDLFNNHQRAKDQHHG